MWRKPRANNLGDKELGDVEKLIWRLDEERMRKDSGGAGRSGKTSPSWREEDDDWDLTVVVWAAGKKDGRQDGQPDGSGECK